MSPSEVKIPASSTPRPGWHNPQTPTDIVQLFFVRAAWVTSTFKHSRLLSKEYISWGSFCAILGEMRTKERCRANKFLTLHQGRLFFLSLHFPPSYLYLGFDYLPTFSLTCVSYTVHIPSQDNVSLKSQVKQWFIQVSFEESTSRMTRERHNNVLLLISTDADLETEISFHIDWTLILTSHLDLVMPLKCSWVQLHHL